MTRMSLIVFEKTGHVLGAFTRAASPDGPVTVAQIAGDALTLRDADTGEELVHVPTQFLKVQTIDRDDDVITSHRDYVLKDGIPLEKSDPNTPPAFVSAAKELTVTLDGPATEKVAAYAQVEAEGEPAKVVPIEIAVGASDGVVQLTLTPGTTYRLLALIPGYRAQFISFAA